jgi:chemotaxis-related protein WspD
VSAPRPGPAAGGPSPRAGAGELLDRAPLPEYLAAWGRALQRTLFDAGAQGDLAGLVFRLGEERYLLPTTCVREVHRPQRVHRVPGRVGEVFRGLVCLRGELLLCADLHALLGAERGRARPADGAPTTARSVVIEQGGARWAFETDEVLDVRRYVGAKVAPPQVTVARAAVHYTDGLVDLGDGRAARLDADRLFAGLARSLT